MHLILFLALLFAKPAHAGAQVGTITLVQGPVTIFSNPGKSMEGPPPHALYEGMYYSVSDAKVGDRLDYGNIIRTQPGGKARVVYDNGDQFLVAPATAFAITWNKDAPDAKTEMKLSYGGARGVIAKGGPRSHLTIRTRTATMGVRGTDFFIGVDPETGATETATLRGSVAVASSASPETPPVEVKAGETASVAAPPASPPAQAQTAAPSQPPAAPAIEVRKASVQELHAIQKNSEVKAEPGSPPPPPEAAKVVAQLEAQAQVATLNDIRIANPDLAAKLEKEPAAAKSVDAINEASLAELVPAAPKLASNSVIAEVGELPTHTSTAVSEEVPEAAPLSRSSGLRLLRGELSLIAVNQGGSESGSSNTSQSMELAWMPRYQLGRWGWFGARLGASLLKGVTGAFPMLEGAGVFGVRVYGPASAELFMGTQQWLSNGGGFEQGANLVWFPEERSFGLVERWFVGITHINGSGGSNGSSGPGNFGPYPSFDAVTLRAGIGI